jgi:hypothetical protein
MITDAAVSRRVSGVSIRSDAIERVKSLNNTRRQRRR